MGQGKLIVFEGIDGAGKSTNLNFTELWLEFNNVKTLRTEWKSSPNVKQAISEGKKNVSLKPLTFSLLHAADLYDRQDKEVSPHLAKGGIVLADRWYCTGYVRDHARGLNMKFLESLYSYAIRPDIIFYFDLPVDVALERIKKRGKLGFYEAGMDIGLSTDIDESYKIFQKQIQAHYNELAKEEGFVIIDATKSIEEIQGIIQDKIKSILD